ncbi:MAG: peptidylprolyl isomerase, partial [Oscillospiraceae bacterium]|nr:peptidylprolyl isomerase [Oscillospiraceae bacterium]
TFSDESAYYVLFFIDRHDIDYNVVNMRHILVQPTQNEDGTVSDENAEAAIAETDSYLKEWEASDGTEETFAAMANQYSDDTGSNTNGGLYTDIYKGQMVRPVNDWLFDPERQIGDVTIVQSSFGYHLMYFAGTGANYKTTTVSAAMQTEDYDKWLADTTATVAVNLKENVGSVML